MRLNSAILACLIFGASAAQTAPVHPSSIIVHIWTSSRGASLEETFNVDLASHAATTQPAKQTARKQTPGWVAAQAEDRKRNHAIYERMLADRGKDAADLQLDRDLIQALSSVEQRKGGGSSSEDFFVASPNGAWAVYRSGWNDPLLLINVATLATRRLVDDDGGQSPAVAWSADSRYLAFAPPGAKELSIFDTERQAIAFVKDVASPWIAEVSWSPDGEKIAVFGLPGRRMDKNPIALLSAGAGHPVFRNDGVLFIFDVHGDAAVSVPLKQGISEVSTPRIRIDWK